MATSLMLDESRLTPRLARYQRAEELERETDRLNLAALYYAPRMLERLTDQFQEHCGGSLVHDCACPLCKVIHP